MFLNAITSHIGGIFHSRVMYTLGLRVGPSSSTVTQRAVPTTTWRIALPKMVT